jgi:hypothetical protein
LFGFAFIFGARYAIARSSSRASSLHVCFPADSDQISDITPERFRRCTINYSIGDTWVFLCHGETDGRMNMPTAELFDITFMNEVELKMCEDKRVITDAWIKSLKHDLTVVVTLGDVGAEAYFKGQRFFCKAHQVNIVNRTGGGDEPLTPGSWTLGSAGALLTLAWNAVSRASGHPQIGWPQS